MSCSVLSLPQAGAMLVCKTRNLCCHYDKVFCILCFLLSTMTSLPYDAATKVKQVSVLPSGMAPLWSPSSSLQRTRSPESARCWRTSSAQHPISSPGLTDCLCYRPSLLYSRDSNSTLKVGMEITSVWMRCSWLIGGTFLLPVMYEKPLGCYFFCFSEFALYCDLLSVH